MLNELIHNNEITSAEKYVQVHNEIIRLTQNHHPTGEDFQTFHFLEKQIKNLTLAIAKETLKKEGYIFNEQTQMWETHNSKYLKGN